VTSEGGEKSELANGHIDPEEALFADPPALAIADSARWVSRSSPCVPVERFERQDYGEIDSENCPLARGLAMSETVDSERSEGAGKDDPSEKPLGPIGFGDRIEFGSRSG
jgi:hypothetical protein